MIPFLFPDSHISNGLGDDMANDEDSVGDIIIVEVKGKQTGDGNGDAATN